MDIHTNEEATLAAKFVDVLQIPAFLCRQTGYLLQQRKQAKQSISKKDNFYLEAMKYAVQIKESGNDNVLITDRGTMFGYLDLVVDMRGIPTMQKFAPVILDITHSLQQPNQSLVLRAVNLN